MTWQLLTAGSLLPAGLVLDLADPVDRALAVGLLAGRLLRRRGPAVQSALYRTILVAVLLCPIASMAMAAMGFTGLVIRLPGSLANTTRTSLAMNLVGRDDTAVDRRQRSEIPNRDDAHPGADESNCTLHR